MTKTLGLCMLVKNESKIILHCLNSIYKYIDYWVINDTGSTDNTQDIITTFFKNKGINGQLIHDSFVNFGHNQNLILNIAKSKTDYILILDPDMIVNVHDKNFKDHLYHFGYNIQINEEKLIFYTKTLLIDTIQKWIVSGELHTYIHIKDKNSMFYSIFTKHINSISIDLLSFGDISELLEKKQIKWESEWLDYCMILAIINHKFHNLFNLLLYCKYKDTYEIL